MPLRGASAPPLGVLWLTPMRALAADSARAMQAPLDELGLSWSIGVRTGDTTPAERARQDRRFPTALVTTPESLSLMLTRDAAKEELAAIHTVIVDEWHELMGSKRGVQVQLALARLKRWNPGLVVWGLSATLGNLDEAMQVLLGDERGVAVRGRIDKNLVIDTLLPAHPGRFSWGGHLGKQMQLPVVEEIERSATTLVFVNMRSQAEAWYQFILDARPDWAGVVALHHGSLDKEVRDWVELGLKEGRLKAVVATSSLDLGVDFLPVERVLQIGSAKGVARLLQRAGRSGHAPGRASRITLVPTNTLELVEAVAARRAALAGGSRSAPPTTSRSTSSSSTWSRSRIGGGFTAEAMYEEVKGAWAYRKLAAPSSSGRSTSSSRAATACTRIPSTTASSPAATASTGCRTARIARRHKLNVGTIVSDSSMQVKYLSGGRIGVVEEGFVARLKKGDCFVFAGRTLEFVRAEEMTAYVRRADGKKAFMIAWAGAKMPLSSELADSVLEVLADAAQGDFFDPELEAARPMLETQMHLSRIPTPKTLLIEQLESREGQHLFLYPFAGRNAHIGLGSLLAWRLSKDRPNTFSIVINDYGLELLSARPVDPTPLVDQSLVRGGRSAARCAREPQLERAGATALPRDRPRLGPHQPGLSGPAEVDAPAAGVELAVLRGLSQVRRRQPPARPGRERGAEPGARHQAPARGAAAHARAARRLLRAGGAEPVRAAADGRALPREAVDREAEGSARPDAEGDGEGSRAGLSFSIVAATRIPGDKMSKHLPSSTGSRAEASSSSALRRRTVLAAGAALSLPFGAARAQAFPNKPITLIVPWPAGGSTDRHHRLLAELAGKHLGQTDRRREQARRRRHHGAGDDGADRQARRLHHRAVPDGHAARAAHAEGAVGSAQGLHFHHGRLGLHLRPDRARRLAATRPSTSTSTRRARARARSTTAPPASARRRTC